MFKKPFCYSSPEGQRAIAHIADRLSDSLLAQCLGNEFPEQGKLFLATETAPPLNIAFCTDWSKTSCTDWLIAEVYAHLDLHPSAFVLFEDVVSSPEDPYLSGQEHPSYWCYKGRMFWPVFRQGITPAIVRQVKAWAVSTKTIVGFATLPQVFASRLSTKVLSDSEFNQIGSSIRLLVTDVFDGGGYMVWERQLGRVRTPRAYHDSGGEVERD